MAINQRLGRPDHPCQARAMPTGKPHPTLCRTWKGSRRLALALCIVEISGTRTGYSRPCTTPVPGRNVGHAQCRSNTHAIPAGFARNCFSSSVITILVRVRSNGHANCRPWPPKWASHGALCLQLPQARRRFVSSALRSRPEPLHFVHKMTYVSARNWKARTFGK